jgi:glutamate transport system substrate-binding protein
MRRPLFPAFLRRTPALFAVLGLAGAVALASCGEKKSEPAGVSASAPKSSAGAFPAESTMARLHDAGTITVGTKFDQPLFGIRNLSGVNEGFDVEIAKIITNALGIPPGGVKFVETVTANREPFIQQGKVDIVVATYTINDKRKQVVDFAGPYYVAGQQIMVRADEAGITGKDTLAGKKVCSVTGSTSVDKVRAVAPAADIVLFDVYSKCAEALKNRQVDAVSTDNGILLGLMEHDPGAFKLAGEPFTTEPYGIGLKKGDQDFRNFINDTLEAAYSDGRWKAAYTSTIGKVLPTVPVPPPVDRYAA